MQYKVFGLIVSKDRLPAWEMKLEDLGCCTMKTLDEVVVMTYEKHGKELDYIELEPTVELVVMGPKASYKYLRKMFKGVFKTYDTYYGTKGLFDSTKFRKRS